METASLTNDIEQNSAALGYRKRRMAHWDALARQRDARPGWGGFYRRRLGEIYRFLVSPGQRVLELGCAQGDLLAELKPSVGVGVDFSGEMIARAKGRHPELEFAAADVHELPGEGTFDAIILSDLINDVWNVQRVLEEARKRSHARTRVILNFYSRLWETPLGVAEMLGVAKPTLRQNWLDVGDVRNLLYLAGFETMRNWQEILCPLRVPGVGTVCNKFLVKLWPMRGLALTNFVVARPAAEAREAARVSVVVPARNEAGNIEAVFARTPKMGTGTQLVFVEGHSTDGTYAAIEAGMAAHPEVDCKLLKQAGQGKGDAVRAGFAACDGEMVMILDADLTVSPEDLPAFYEALRSGKAEFANGVRLVYPRQQKAMRFLNLVGNKFFGAAFSWVMGQRIKDTLCGTKGMWRRDYELLAANRGVFGDFDPFGDFDLLFGAAKLSLRMVDVPVRYSERTYGATNIHRWKHGWMLLRMLGFAGKRLKFV